MDKIALIDGDSIIYKVGFALEEELEEGVFTLDLANAKDFIDGIIDGITFNTDCLDYELWIGETGTNFRYKIAEDNLAHGYKHNRKESRKPTHYKEMVEYLKKTHNSRSAKDCEVDDAVCYKKSESPNDYILCAIDKDVLYQSVGKHYNYGTDKWIVVTQEEAIYYAYLQTLTGDSTDGYKGCPNIGPVKAKKLLGDPGEHSERTLWAKTLLAYRKSGLGRKEAYATMRLANMHQLKRNKNNKLRIALWTPPSIGEESIDCIKF